jgi:hypothetical protein
MALPVRAKPPLPPGAERRRSERFELLAHVELRLHEEVSLLPVVNISAGGLLLRVEPGALADVAVNEVVGVFLELPDLPDPIALTMDARVVRVTATDGVPESVAVMWKAASGDALAQLAKLLVYVSTLT